MDGKAGDPRDGLTPEEGDVVVGMVLRHAPEDDFERMADGLEADGRPEAAAEVLENLVGKLAYGALDENVPLRPGDPALLARIEATLDRIERIDPEVGDEVAGQRLRDRAAALMGSERVEETLAALDLAIARLDRALDRKLAVGGRGAYVEPERAGIGARLLRAECLRALGDESGWMRAISQVFSMHASCACDPDEHLAAVARQISASRDACGSQVEGLWRAGLLGTSATDAPGGDPWPRHARFEPAPPPAGDDGVEVLEMGSRVLHGGFLEVREHRLRHRRFDGSTSRELRREIVHRGDSACVLPWDPRTDRVLLIRQFLPGAHLAGRPARPLQVVAGMVGAGEEPEAVARREAMEEAGVGLGALVLAQAFLPSPGGSSERVHCYLAETDLSRAGGLHGLAEEDEDVKVEVMTAARAIALLDGGAIEAGPAVVLLSWFARRRAGSGL